VAFCQLGDIRGIVARYAVMEDLYLQTRGMSLQPDYQAAIVQLYYKILSWFNNTLLLSPWLNTQITVTCAELWTSIKESDKVCQNFQITLEAKDNGSTSEVRLG
jgi:hypothetical protein